MSANGPKKDQHVDHKANGGADANPRHDIHLSYLSVVYSLGPILTYKLRIENFLQSIGCFIKLA